jgi:protein-S-isoprenylcysteine O-methyltransferase Ste14
MSRLRSVTIRLSTTLTGIAAYLPILAGIITPMVYLLPAWYFSWDYASLLFPFSDTWHGLVILPTGIAFAVVESVLSILLICTGLAFFLGGLLEMTFRRKESQSGLVDTGPYRIVRHPQHLGIILMLLSVALFRGPLGLPMIGIRPGDVLSCGIMTLLLVAVADYEESRLEELYHDEYDEYVDSVPFLIPGVRFKSFSLPSYVRKGKPIRYILMFALFYVLATGVLFGLSNLHLLFVR